MSMGWGAMKLTIFSWTLYLQSPKSYKTRRSIRGTEIFCNDWIWIFPDVKGLTRVYSSRDLPNLPTLWGTPINEFPLLILWPSYCIEGCLCNTKWERFENKATVYWYIQTKLVPCRYIKEKQKEKILKDLSFFHWGLKDLKLVDIRLYDPYDYG